MSQLSSDPTRRQFLQQSAVAGAAAIAAKSLGATTEPASFTLTNTGPGAIPRKPMGRTGVDISVMGLGGYSLASTNTLAEAKRILAEAFDAGINFFDNAWEYHEGNAEIVMGHALEDLGPAARDQYVLMTKVCTHGRDKKVAMGMLEDSLRRLKTDHLDVWQVHECVYYNEPNLHFRPGGVIEALDQAKKQGKVRFVGFTGHKDPRIHLEMLSHGYPFDTVQMPLNPFDYTYRSFEQHVLPVCNQQGIAVLGMKSLMGGGQATVDMPISVEEALQYAMSLPVATTISGVDSLEVLHQNLAVARDFRPLSDEQMQAIRAKAADAAGDGHLELYKSTMKFDGAIGRTQHGSLLLRCCRCNVVARASRTCTLKKSITCGTPVPRRMRGNGIVRARRILRPPAPGRHPTPARRAAPRPPHCRRRSAPPDAVRQAAGA